MIHFKRKYKIVSRFLLSTALTMLISCQPDELDNGNGLKAGEMDAGFTVTLTEESNTYLLEANQSYLTSQWDLGVGAGFEIGGGTYEVFYPDAGSYTVQHRVSGIGGTTATETQTIDVETSDPLAGNIVRGGKFDTQEDIDQWQVVSISASGTEWNFENGQATVTGGGWNQKGIYQAIEVIEGQEYMIDFDVSSTSGVTNTWFEVFVGTKEPRNGADYSDGGAVAKFSTWGGCANEAFSGKISVVGCDFNGVQGQFIAETAGTHYLVIKCGGEDLKEGVTVDNIEMRAVR